MRNAAAARSPRDHRAPFTQIDDRDIDTIYATYGFTVKSFLVIKLLSLTKWQATAEFDEAATARKVDVSTKAIRDGLTEIEKDGVTARRTRAGKRCVRVSRPDLGRLRELERRRKSRAGIGGRPARMEAARETELHMSEPVVSSSTEQPPVSGSTEQRLVSVTKATVPEPCPRCGAPLIRIGGVLAVAGDEAKNGRNLRKDSLQANELRDEIGTQVPLPVDGLKARSIDDAAPGEPAQRNVDFQRAPSSGISPDPAGLSRLSPPVTAKKERNLHQDSVQTNKLRAEIGTQVPLSMAAGASRTSQTATVPGNSPTVPTEVAVRDPAREQAFETWKFLMDGCGKPVSVYAEPACREAFFRYLLGQQLHIVEDASIRADTVWNKPEFTPDPLAYLESRVWVLKPIKRRTLPGKKTRAEQQDAITQRLLAKARARMKNEAR